MNVKKGAITDDMISERMKGAFEFPGEVFQARRSVIEPETEPEYEDSPLLEKAEGEGKEKEGGLTAFEALLLKDIGKNRMATTSDRYARLGLSVYQGNKARQWLMDKGLVEVKELPTPGGRYKLLSPTEEGLAVLEGLGINPNISHRGGGIQHQYWKRKLGEYFREKGYTVREEAPLGGGKAVDLVAENEKERIAVEVETGKSDGFYNLTKDLGSGFDKVVVVELKKKKD